MKKLIFLFVFALVSVGAFAQNLPTAAIWGSTKLKAVTSNGDTSGTINLDQIRVFANAAGSGATSIASSNGFAGSVSSGVATLSTTVTGMVKGNGTALSAGTAGTDYSAGTSALSTGILKSTTTTGALTIAAFADLPIPAASITNTQLVNNSITFATPGSSGTAPNWSSGSTALGATATLNVPLAAVGVTSGTVSNSAQTIDGNKTFNGSVYSGGTLTANTGLTNNGGLIEAIGTSSTAVTLSSLSPKNHVADATSAAYTITLPTTPTTGTTFTITKKNTSTNYVTITKGGSDTIMGNTSHVIVSAFNPTLFIYNAGVWYVEN